MTAQTSLRPVPSRTPLFEKLRGMDLFAKLSDAELLRLAPAFRERRVMKGEIITRQDDSDGSHFLLLLEGEALVTREDAQGAESLLSLLRAGDLIGESELFDEGPRYATARATVPSALLSLHREEVLRGLKECPDWALGFMGEFSRRSRLFQRRMAGMSHQKVPRRVACILVSLLDEYGVRLKDSEGRRCALLKPRPAQRHIAGLAGTARETVSRLFSQWEKSGWIEDREGGLMIYDEARLRAMAGEG